MFTARADCDGPRLVAVVAVAAVFVSGAAAAKPIDLGPGQAVRIRGTDIACVYGGPANHNGLVCVHDSPAGSRNSWTFRLEENVLNAFHLVGGVQRGSRSWREIQTQDEPQSPAVPDASDLVATISVGARFDAAGTDLACIISRINGVPAVTCAKRSASGAAILASYEAVVTPKLLRIQRVLAGRSPQTIFVGQSGTR